MEMHEVMSSYSSLYEDQASCNVSGYEKDHLEIAANVTIDNKSSSANPSTFMSDDELKSNSFDSEKWQSW